MGTVKKTNMIYELCFLFLVQHIPEYKTKAMTTIKINEISHNCLSKTTVYIREMCPMDLAMVSIFKHLLWTHPQPDFWQTT